MPLKLSNWRQIEERKNEDYDIIKWSRDYKLKFDDFKGFSPSTGITSETHNYDTFAISKVTIKYDFRIDSGRKIINAYALFLKMESWMTQKTPEILRHEQGHFDIAEIFARRFEKKVNECGIRDLHDYFMVLQSALNSTAEECNQEQHKYDIMSSNTMGKDYYRQWITEQLSLP